MTESRLIDTFFSGGASTGAHGPFQVYGSDINFLIPLKDQGYHTEQCSVLGAPNLNGILTPFAVYVQERGVALLNTKHPEAEKILAQVDQMDHFNTAVTPEGLRLYCPIACDDCEMAMRCAVASEEARCRIAKPRALEVDEGDSLFLF